LDLDDDLLGPREGCGGWSVLVLVVLLLLLAGGVVERCVDLDVSGETSVLDMVVVVTAALVFV